VKIQVAAERVCGWKTGGVGANHSARLGAASLKSKSRPRVVAGLRPEAVRRNGGCSLSPDKGSDSSG